MEGLQSLLKWFAEVPFMPLLSKDQHLEKCRALRRWIEEPHSFLARLRLLQTFDGLNLIFSTFSYVNNLGLAHEEAQESILGFFFLLEMNFEGHRPGRPIGSLTPLRHQLVHSTSRSNRKYALTLIYRYTQNDDVIQAMIPELDLIPHVGAWLFETAQPPVVCSISILASVESDHGIQQLRAIPTVTERVMELLLWTHNFSVLTGALTLLRALDVATLISLNAFPTLLQLIPTCLHSGIESHALMALLNLELLIASPASHAHLASSPIISELIVILRTVDRNRYRHITKAILQVFRKLFLDSPDFARASLCRQFRSLAGVALLHDMALHYDSSRRMTSAVMMEKLNSLEANLQSNGVEDQYRNDSSTDPSINNGYQSPLSHHPLYGQMKIATIPKDLVGGVPRGAPGAQGMAGFRVAGAGGAGGPVPPVGSPPDLPDMVADIYATLSASCQDLLTDLPEPPETIDLYCADLLWAPLAILENAACHTLAASCLSYLHQLSLISNPCANQRRHVANILSYILTFISPSWSPSRVLVPHHHHNPLQQPPSPPPLAGPEMLVDCISILTILLQHADTASWHTQEDYASLRMTSKILFSQLCAQDHSIDSRLLQPSIACLIQLARLMEWHDLLERSMAKLKSWLRQADPDLLREDLLLNASLLQAMILAKKSVSMDISDSDFASEVSEIQKPEAIIPTSPCPLLVIPSSFLILATSKDSNTSLIAFVALSSLSSTPRGRAALRQFLWDNAQELRSACALHENQTVSAFATRLTEVLQLHPDVAQAKSRF
jgi:hypothetical protein